MADTSRHILLIGGSGFIGSHLTLRLLEDGHRLRVLDLRRPAIADDRLEWVAGSFADIATLNTALQGCDAVYHLASATLPKNSNDDPAFDIHSNLLPSLALLQAMRTQAVGKLVFISSGGTVYGKPARLPVSELDATAPLCSYGIVKLAIEKYVLLFHRLYGLDATIARLANPYGRFQKAGTGQGAIPTFCEKALRGEPVEIWGDGAVVRDYIHIDDTVDALSRMLKRNCAGRILNIGSGEGTSLNALIDCIEQALGAPVTRQHLPARDFDVPAIYLDTSAAQTTLGWQCRTPLADGIRGMLDSLRR